MSIVKVGTTLTRVFASGTAGSWSITAPAGLDASAVMVLSVGVSNTATVGSNFRSLAVDGVELGFPDAASLAYQGQSGTYVVLSPVSGATLALAYSTYATAKVAMAASFYNGVSRNPATASGSNPPGNVSASGTSTAPSVSVPTQTGNLTVGTVAARGTPTVTAAAGNTALGTAVTSGGSASTNVRMTQLSRTTAGALGGTLSASGYWIVSAVELIQATTTPPVTPTRRRVTMYC